MRSRHLSLRVYYFLSFASLGVYVPFFPRWLESRDLKGAAMGSAMALMPTMGILAPPVFGFFADAFGLRGRLLSVACAGAASALCLVALAASHGQALGVVGLFASVLLFAFFRSPMFALADVIAMEEVAKGGVTYPRLRLWGSLGFLVAAVASGRALDPAGPLQIPLTIAGALVAAMVASFALPGRSAIAPSPASALRGGPVRELLRDAGFRLFLVTSLLSQAAHSNYDICFSLHLRDVGVDSFGVGVAWAIGVAVEIGLMALGAGFLERRRPAALLAVALGGASARWVLIAFVRSPVVLLCLQPLHAVSFALMWLSSVAFVRSRAPGHVLATAQGLFMASTAVGSVFGMVTWGAIYRRSGGGVTFGLAAIVAALACGLAVWLWSRDRRPPSLPQM